MTIYLIHGRPHIEGHNGYQAISEYEYYMAIEEGHVSEVKEVSIYD